MFGAFHAMNQFHGGGTRVARHFHFQFHLILIVQFRPQRGHMQVRRHDPLQIFEHARPRECLALNQAIQKLRLVARAAVGGLVEFGLILRPLLVAFRNLCLQLRDDMAIAAGIGPAAFTVQLSRNRVSMPSSPTPNPQRAQNSRASS